MGMQLRKRGFTIVELLIVIVIIAILATITIVAYNGIQQRAHNSAKLSTVGSVVKFLSLYHAEHGAYPNTNNVRKCLTIDNKCTDYNGTKTTSSNTDMMDALRKYGTFPATSGDDTSGTYYGVTYIYNSGRTLDGVASPLVIIFWLDGTNQTCSAVGGAISVKDTPGGNMDMTPAPRSKADTGTGQTRCYLMFAS